MGQTLKALAIAFGSAIVMAVGIELVRHYEGRITATTDEILLAGGRAWARAVDEHQHEVEVRRAIPWINWYLWQVEHDALEEEHQR